MLTSFRRAPRIDDFTRGYRLLLLLGHAFRLGSASMSTQAGKNCVCTECTVAWVASSSPAIGERAGVGRGWRIDGDGWLD